MTTWTPLNKNIDFVTWANTLLTWATATMTWAGLSYWSDATKH